MQVKVCTQCRIEKPINKFYKHSNCRFGVRAVCKKCSNIQTALYYKNNKEKCGVISKNYKENNKEKYKTYYKNYRETNRKHRNALANVWFKNKRKTDSKFKLNINISSGIYKSLKGNKNGKHWESLVGYTLTDLKKHLEKQFTDGMTWKNHGMWHIDHKTPIVAFNFIKPEHSDFKKCWALSNLQPMWANKNCSKGASLTKHFQPSLLLE